MTNIIMWNVTLVVVTMDESIVDVVFVDSAVTSIAMNGVIHVRMIHDE